jgi:hypothetical protein
MVRVCKSVSKDISFNILDSREANDFENLKVYIKSYGPHYHQNLKDPNSKEYHYHCCDSSVFINEFPEKAVIKVVSPRHSSLECMKLRMESVIKRHLGD